MTPLQRWLLIGLIALFGIISGSLNGHAHDWYSNTGCCSGTDCSAVPLDADWVQPSKDGCRVTLSLAQARLVNPNAAFAVDQLVPWSKVRMPPAKAHGDPALYHLCIPSSYSGVYCLFAVPGL